MSDLVDTLTAKLTTDNYEQAVEIAGLYDMVRGYDTIKLANVERYRAAVGEALAGW